MVFALIYLSFALTTTMSGQHLPVAERHVHITICEQAVRYLEAI